MTQQNINVGTGPDSYTGESLRTAFQKVNDNFSQLYAGNVGANISGNIITANGFVTSGNVVTGNVTAAGNISAYYFIGDGSRLTGVTASANTGSIAFSNLTIAGSVAGNIVLDPAGDGNVNILSTMRTQAMRVGNIANSELVLQISGNTASISTAGRGNGNVSLRLSANDNSKGSITIRADDGHMGFGITPNGYEYAFNGEVRANAFYADADFPVGYQFTTPGGDTGMTHDYQNDVNGNVSLVIIKHDSVAAAKFYDNNHTILSGNLVVSQTGNVFGAAYPDAFIQAYANVNSYSQTIIQNLNSGNLASSDVVATANNGDDNGRYINMGIASSTYNVVGFGVVGSNDGYLYVAGNSYAGPFSNTSNLNIGSTTGSVRTWVGAGTLANVVTTVSPGSFTVNGTISTTGNISSGNISTGRITLTNGAVIKDTDYLAVAFGSGAGTISQGFFAVAVGSGAGFTTQGTAAVAIGSDAGGISQGINAVAIGQSAGYTGQGINAVAIGINAGYTNQGNNSIIINATGSTVDQTTANTFTVAPVRNDVANVAQVVFYNTTSKEVTYGNTINVAGNITANYFIGDGSQLTGVTTSVPGQTILPTIQTISITATSNPFALAGGEGSASVTVANVIPVTEYGVIITDGTSNEKYKTGALGSIPGTVSLNFNTGLNNLPFTVYAYVTSNAGTFYSNSATGTSGICLLAGTQIALSGGSHKSIEDITYTDKMLSWDFDRGCYAETTAIWIKRSETGSQYNLLTFSDGTTLRTFDQHRIFNKQAGAFTYPMTDETPVGTVTVNEHGQEITLINKQVIVDTIEYYNVITDYHMNLFSDTVLTSCRFNNIYPITDMKFVKDGRKLRNRSEFYKIDDRFFHGLRLSEQQFDLDIIEWYVARLESSEITCDLEVKV